MKYGPFLFRQTLVVVMLKIYIHVDGRKNFKINKYCLLCCHIIFKLYKYLMGDIYKYNVCLFFRVADQPVHRFDFL